MTTLKQGDLVKDHRENTRKVLGVCGEVVHLSFSDRQDAFANSYTEVTLRESGYTWDTPAWEPSFGMKYWYIDTSGEIFDSTWDKHAADLCRKDFLGIYQTKELAEAALLEIRRKLNK